jgi:hypothetical protein
MSIGMVIAPSLPLAEAQKVEQEDATGTDPRGFSPKFMPYYRYNKLDNDLEAHDMTLFGMFAFTPSFAMTYEWSIGKRVDYSDVKAFENSRDLPPSLGDGSSGLPSGGVPFEDLEDDGDVVGMGDLGLRFFYKPKALEFGKPGRSFSLMFGVEMIFPTATKDVLGSEAFIVSPLVTIVLDTPTHGFIAGMNFYDIDAFKDDSREDTSRYRGRWFLMQPLSRPGPGVLSGIYLLPEFQPVYDFENEEFSFWIGPELGKILAPGKIAYVKPGFGVDPDPNEREFSFEFGFRWFF